jgi:segregation and condensation protein A
MQEKILSMLMQEEEITWQSIILDLIKSGELDPWDIDISLLTAKYIEIIRQMQEANLFISAKILLASAMLLKIKSERLLTDGIAAIDYYLYPQEETEELETYMENGKKRIKLDVEPRLTIKTPLARKRRITVNDLLTALHRALEVNERRIIRHARVEMPSSFIMPEKKIDINDLITSVYGKLQTLFAQKPQVSFFELTNEHKREEKIFHFISMLYLAYQNKVTLEQQDHFGDIYITNYKPIEYIEEPTKE